MYRKIPFNLRLNIDIVVDGYFTSWPENSTILLRRVANGMPAMVMYNYGNGTVIATTAYEDWAYTHGQSTSDGKALVRDVLAWARDRKEIQDYAQNAPINISVNVTNKANTPASKVMFTVIDPDKSIVKTVNVTATIGVGETKTINFTYTAPSKLGIYWLDYSLIDSNGNLTQVTYEAEGFAVSIVNIYTKKEEN